MSKILRDILEAHGLTNGEIYDAVQSARKVTRQVSKGAGVAAKLLTEAADRAKPGSKSQIVAIVLAGVASNVEGKADFLLGKKR